MKRVIAIIIFLLFLLAGCDNNSPDSIECVLCTAFPRHAPCLRHFDSIKKSLLCNYFEIFLDLRNEFMISGVLLVGVVWYVDLIYLKSNIKSKFK